jgi:hypothetical protein
MAWTRDDDDENPDVEHHEYIFGFGSMINITTHDPWLTSSSSSISSESVCLPGRPAGILAKFGCQRGWNFRSNTGFTALGISYANAPDEATDINGVVFQIGRDMLPDFDRREVGYDRVLVPNDCMDWSDSYGVASGDAMSDIDHRLTSIPANAQIWVYIPCKESCLIGDEDHPVLQATSTR